MVGIGDSWGTREELLHPRGPDGRWIRKAGIPKGLIARILDALANFRPRMFQSQGQANQYARNVGMRKPARFQGGRGYGRLLSDLGPTNEDLRDGVIDNPSTAKFVKMMDESATELPDDVILTRYVGVDAFGFTPQTAQGTSSDTDPGIRGMSGKLIADRGYSTTVIGEPRGAPPQGSVRMVIAARKGTKVVVPAAGQNDSTMFLDRDQALRVTKIEPDGSGGWVMYAMTEEDSRAVPEPIGGPVGAGTRDSRQREAAVREVGRIEATREKRPDDTAEAADEAARRQRFEEGQKDVVPSPMQEAERRRVEQLQQQAGVQPRTEPIQARSIGGEPRPEAGTGGAPASQAPGAPEAEAVPRRTVDLRLAVRDANIEAPAAGPNRKRFNDAYEGVISGKKEPIDAVRELRRDARDLRGQEGGREDADILDRLADVIKQQYALPEQGKVKKFVEPKDQPQARTEGGGGLPRVAPAQLKEISQREEESRAVRAAKKAEARETKAAPAAKKGRAAKKATPEAAPEAAPSPVAKKAPAKMAAPAELTPEQQIKGLFNGKRPTNAQLRQMGEDNNLGFGPKEPRSEMILAILGARPSRGRQRGEVPVEPPVKKATKRVSTEDRVATHLLDRMNPEVRDQIMADMPEQDRRAVEEAVQRVREAGPPGKKATVKKAAPKRRDDLDNMSKEELTEVADREGVQVSGSPSEATLRKRIRDSREAQTPGDDLDSMTKQQLLDEAARREVEVPKSWTKDRIKSLLREEQFRRPEKKTPEQRRAQAKTDAELDRELRIGELFEGEKPTVAALREYARTRGMEPTDATIKQGYGKPLNKMTRAELIGLILSSLEGERRFTGDRVAAGGAPNASTVRQQIIRTPEGQRGDLLDGILAPLTQPQRRRLAKELGVKGQDRQREQGPILDAIREHFRGAVPEGAEAPTPAKKAAKAAAPKKMTIGEARRLSAVEAIRANEVTGGESQAWRTILSRVDGGDWTVARARKEAKDSARYWREQAATVRRGGGRFNPEKVEESASRLERVADQYDKLAEDLTISQSVTKTDKFMRGGAPDSVEVARERQRRLDRARGYGNLTTEIDELLNNEASSKALAQRIRTRGKVQTSTLGGPEDSTIDAADIEELAKAAEAGDNDRVRALARQLAEREGITQIGNAGEVVPFNPREQRLLSPDLFRGRDNPTHVTVTRAGHRINDNGEDVLLERATVDAPTPKELEGVQRGARGASRVPDGSVKGDRTQAPIDNQPRKREFGEAWDSADLDTEGAAGRSLKEVRDDVASGKITPEEGIRRIEGEIAFNQEDLNEVDANLREGDLTPEQRDRLQSDAAKLQNAIDAHKKASKFMRLYFRDEKPTVQEVKISLDSEGLQALERATPDDLREAAKMQGLDPPKGTTKDEILQDMVRQVAGKVARERGLIPKKAPAKKAAKAAKKAAPQIPTEREKLDIRTIGAGIDFDENDPWTKRNLDAAQAALDGDQQSLPQMARDLDESATRRMTTAVYEHGQWHADSPTLSPEENAARRAEHEKEYNRVKAEATKIRELAERLKKMRRPSKRTAAKKAAPEVQAAETRADNAEARLINERLERLNAAKSREQGGEALDGLTMPELRRIGEQMGIKGRSKQELRDKILDRFVPEALTPEAQAALEGRQKGALDRLRRQVGTPETRLTPRQIMDRWKAEWENPMSREQAAALVEPLSKKELLEIAEEFNIPRRRSMTIPDLRREIVQAGVGARLDSIATRGFTGRRPGEGGLERSTDLPSLERRGRSADIPEPDRQFSGTASGLQEANRRLRSGESPTDVARFLRERAGQVAKADIAEEGRRFRTELDNDSLRSLRKSNAEYLRRLATMLQQEEKSQRPAKKAAPKVGRNDRVRLTGEDVDYQVIETTDEDIRVRPVLDNGTLGPAKTTKRTSVESLVSRPAKKAAPSAPEAPSNVTPLPSARATKVTQAPTGSRMSDKPIIENTWGDFGQGEIGFHGDGIIGMGLQTMGDDQRLEVDGDALANVIGRLATRAARGQISQEQLIDQLRRLGQRLPADSTARRRVERMVTQLDAPPRAPLTLPEGTPAPLRELMDDLSKIPLARGTSRRTGGGDFNEMDTLREIVAEAAKNPSANRQLRARRLIELLQRRLLNHRHESMEGKAEIDRVIRKAMEALARMAREPART